MHIRFHLLSSKYLKGLVSIKAVDDYIESLHKTSEFFEDNNFWKAEAEAWRKLFELQRGGYAFDAVQEELVKVKATISELEAALKKREKELE